MIVIMECEYCFRTFEDSSVFTITNAGLRCAECTTKRNARLALMMSRNA